MASGTTQNTPASDANASLKDITSFPRILENDKVITKLSEILSAFIWIMIEKKIYQVDW